jgi:hypothetical protein
MGSTQIGDDRISKLADGVLGHILSFLPAREAARAAALSTRWRRVLASVHTVSLEEPEKPIPSYDDDDDYHSYSPGYGPPKDPNPPPPFTAAVTAALLARHRCVRSDDAAQPLRALRVDMEGYHGGDSRTVDNWISYALKQAGTELELDLRFRRATICIRPYSLHTEARARTAVSSKEVTGDDDGFPSNDNVREAISASEEYIHNENSAADDVNEALTDEDYDDADGSDADDVSEAMTDEDYDDAVSSESEKVAYVPRWELPPPEYTVPSGLFSCRALRCLRIGPCRLSPPGTIMLPSLEELLLVRVSDDGQEVQRLISACPGLADLTLEACDTVTTLSLLDNRLRRLALRCCHNLASVAVGSSELQAFEYRGTVPEDSFLTISGTSGSSLTSCKVDICGEEVWSSEELTKLREFLQLFVDTKHLHLQSARLGSGFHHDTFVSFQKFSNLRHLEMMGCLPHDDATIIVSAMSRILQHAPEIEVLSLVFQPEPEPGDYDYERLPGGRYGCKERQLLDVHHLQYNKHNVLDAPTATIACLTDRVREINLVHYQGGRAQRTLAKFLLCNALVLDELYCGFVPGPLWIQTELRREIEGWAMNNPERRIFY